MHEVKRYIHDKSKNELYLYFDTKEEFVDIRRFFASKIRISKLVDNQDIPPLPYDVFVGEKTNTLLIRDSEHAKSPGQGVQSCLDYLIKCKIIQDEPTLPAEAVRTQHLKSN
jgi:hypothetical protein